MKLEVGKKYITRNGGYYAEITHNDGSDYMPFIGILYPIGDSRPFDTPEDCWNEGGLFFSVAEDSLDLVEEYTVPKTETNELIAMLIECVCQIEYLHDKFQETGTGNTVLSRAKALIDSMKTN
jgi:hypothetical protein